MTSKAIIVWSIITSFCAFPLSTGAYAAAAPTHDARSEVCSRSLLREPAGDKHVVIDSRQHLTLLGLVSPAVVAGSIFALTAGAPPESRVTYCLDGVPIWVALHPPYFLGEQNQGVPSGFSLRNIAAGDHHLQAIAASSDGQMLLSDMVLLRVIPTMNNVFSQSLSTYSLQPTVQQPLASILRHTATPGAELTQQELNIRYQIAAMYLNFGIDLSLDDASDQSAVMASLLPHSWAVPVDNARSPPTMRFSHDAPYYQAIPADWPRVRLPRGYLKTIQLNTSQGGDGIGYGIVVAQPDSPVSTVTSMWYTQEDTRKVVDFRIPGDWRRSLPTLESGDRHVIFIDPLKKSFVSLYKATADEKTGQPTSLYASSPTPFNSLGDHGGSTASGFAELPVLIQPGEATSADGSIRHAIGGPVSRPWAARVYPATSRDYGVLTSKNSCTGKGLTNTGLVPYGGIIQLDPSLDLTKLQLSRPALRILRAMQTYGYYVMDFGCADLDIYTALSEKELAPYGGLYGRSSQVPGVQAEIASVITTSDLYVVPPLVKR